jgi:hypothetical protein
MARELPGYVSGWCGRGNHCDHDDPALRCRGTYGSVKHPADCHCTCHATAGATTTITLFETVQA